MKITGKLQLFIEERQIKGGEKADTMRVFRGSISSPAEKDEKGNTTKFYHKSVDVYLVGEKFKDKDKLPLGKMYTLDVKDGFLGAKEYEVGDDYTRHDICLVISDAEIIDAKDVTSKVETKKKDSSTGKTEKSQVVKDLGLPF